MFRKLAQLTYTVLAAIFFQTCASAEADFAIVIEREPPQGKLVPGQISVNGRLIGGTYENVERQILPGTFDGVLRYVSGKNFVQGPLGTLGQKGDFLIEVSNVPGPRTDILLHGGNKPYQSEGCILLGPVGRDPSSLQPTIGPDHPLRQLRKVFYGTDEPVATPNKRITITIK